MTPAPHPVILDILKGRGVTAPEAVEEFLSEKPKLTHEPGMLLNMDGAVDFVSSAVERGRQICIYGDYDVDGVAAVALLVQVLRLMTDKVNWYIPSRFDEGYGLNKEALLNIANAGGQAVITVDCGSVSAAEIAFGLELGLEILVTDHHNTAGDGDCCIVNPKQPGETYPFDGLAGCGVAFKLAQALQRRHGLPKHILNDVLDLVAVATIADVVPLIDENRTLTKYGLRALNTSARPGLRGLMARIGLKEGLIGARDVGFSLAPHINAAGRMGEAGDVVELLLTEDEKRIPGLAERLATLNACRKRIQKEIFETCVRMVEADPEGPPSILLLNAGCAHEGVTGIVAGKLKEHFNRPAIILTHSAGADGRLYLKGTGRSIATVDLHAQLQKYETLFEKFGGHRMACGFLMRAEHEEALREGLAADLDGLYSQNPALFENGVLPDVSLEPADISLELAVQLELLAPFGSGNPEPLFEISCAAPADVALMGDGRHLRFKAGNLSCVLFGHAADYEDLLRAGREVRVLGVPSRNVWNGRESVQFVVKEVSEVSGANAPLL